MREGIASALDARGLFAGARVLDLFAGSGALGFEALSRGAASLVAVDSNAQAVRSIVANAKAFGVSDRVAVMKLDLLARGGTAAKRIGGAFTLAFIDAPYARMAVVPDLIAALAAHDVFAPGAIVVAEHPASGAPAWPARVAVFGTYRYGDTGVTLLVVAPAPGT